MSLRSLLSLLVVAAVAAGCGGGGEQAELDPIIATWPFAFAPGSDDDFTTVDVGFAEAEPTPREPVLLAVSLADGDTGIGDPVGAAVGGLPWAAVAERLTDGLDSRLIASVIVDPGTVGQIRQESENLIGPAPGSPDLVGFEITTLQVRIDVLTIGPDDSPPPALRVDDRSRRATRAVVEGAVLVRGRPLE